MLCRKSQFYPNKGCTYTFPFRNRFERILNGLEFSFSIKSKPVPLMRPEYSVFSSMVFIDMVSDNHCLQNLKANCTQLGG